MSTRKNARKLVTQNLRITVYSFLIQTRGKYCDNGVEHKSLVGRNGLANKVCKNPPDRPKNIVITAHSIRRSLAFFSDSESGCPSFVSDNDKALDTVHSSISSKTIP